MAILEVGISFMQEVLLESQYYSSTHMIDKNVRMNLLNGLDSISSSGFGEELSGFTLGEYSILMSKKGISEPNHPDHTENLMLYAIVDRETNEAVVKQNMVIALENFLNLYSLNDIFQKKTKKFKDFDQRLRKIFKDLILKNEDRFKSLF